MHESELKLRNILRTFFPLYSSMSKQHQFAMEAACIPNMKVLFDAPVTSPLSEIDTEDVSMFFVHLPKGGHAAVLRPDSFQTKVLIKILTSLALTHNNYVHLKEVKVLAESLLQNVKEKSCVRYISDVVLFWSLF